MGYCYRPEEVKAIIDHCYAHDHLHWLGDVVVALAYTGMRIGELAQLQWKSVCFESNSLSIEDNSQSGQRISSRNITSTKSGKSRTVALRDELRSALERIHRHPDGRVFHGPRGGVLKPDTVRNVFKREVLDVLKKKLPARPDGQCIADGRLHSFRHFFCSECATAGVPVQTVMTWLGHQDSEMVRHYHHLHDEEAQRQIRQLRSVGGPGGRPASSGSAASHSHDDGGDETQSGVEQR